MPRAELDAAHIADPALRGSYELCRGLHARHGRTYFLATRLLTPAQRPAVHALYGFARWADDIVDEPREHERPERCAERLNGLGDELLSGLESGSCSDPLLAAVVDTAVRHGLSSELFEDFLRSMRMDLSVRDYPNRAALGTYVRGSAEVIGLQVLPVLGAVVPLDEAAPHAAALGRAFQLTNFLRDVAEDLERGRVYLPADELAAHGVDRDLLHWCHRNRRTDPRVRAALVEQHAHTREIYRFAEVGIRMLDPVSRPCVETAHALYSRILDRIEADDFAVFTRRAVVGKAYRARIAGAAWFRAVRARERGAHRPAPTRGARS
ncbi:phytoene/squalene synthase family protein [Saccharopolyspora karakumensis]|uniref:Phytoene/squalene synthase family protein n=1 Tax=Saccharopolyspora karakumensis TaxID=2530386 RepID=A0A4R5BGI3_9PSEU|nr:phytoene/squalene synthase family protein [Saccharopolyspora karakumensis]TDD84010.1 phytoene/squalene synthase family protein [Saccharopolyspora karakumensis]